MFGVCGDRGTSCECVRAMGIHASLLRRGALIFPGVFPCFLGVITLWWPFPRGEGG